MKTMSEAEIGVVGGGGDPGEDYAREQTEYWQDQLLRYKTGLSNVFGDMNDLYLTDENGHAIP